MTTNLLERVSTNEPGHTQKTLGARSKVIDTVAAGAAAVNPISRHPITMHADFCLEALEEALAKYGTPEIFNTDQGSQFTSTEFTGALKDQEIRISMDGKGAWRDNVFVERFWKTSKYEEVYLKAYDGVSQARESIGRYIEFYNRRRPHSVLGGQAPDYLYFATSMLEAA